MTKIAKISAGELAEIEALAGIDSTRKPMALGGAYEAADRFDKQLAGWAPPLRSADGDLIPDKQLLDARSRDMFRNDAYVQSGAATHKDSIVGSMYVLSSKPMSNVLGKSEGWDEAFQEEVESLFTLWAESPSKWPDAAAQNDFTQIVRLATGVYTYTGEVLATAEWLRDSGRDFSTAIQMVDTDRLCQPFEQMNNPLVRGGIKHDRRGRHLSYFIRVAHPTDYRQIAMLPTGQYFREVEAEKPWGRKQVLFLREQMRVDQTRAVSDLVAGLKELAITKKFRDVTLQNAVVNAMYAATIESEMPPEAVYAQLGGGNNIGDSAVAYAETLLGAISEYANAAQHMKIDGVRIPHLFPGTKLQLRPMGTPGGVGQQFEQSLLRYLAASLNISYEELSRDFTKTNYSSARAAMAGTWRFMQSRKKMVADGTANFVFRLWLEEAVNNDKLSTFRAREAAQLYTNGRLNMMFDALSAADWIGAARGQIDELKETQAAVLRIKWGLSTHEDELSRLGKDWRKVFAQMEREQKERDRRGIVLVEDNSVNAASGAPRDQSSDTEEKSADDSETEDKKQAAE
jgi:lambda family phage portal protein